MKELEFSPATTRYESTAIHETSQGQNFLFQVSSSEKSEVEKITNNLKIFLDETIIESENYSNVIVELADIDIGEKIQNLKFNINNSESRTIVNQGLTIITKQEGQLAELKNAFIVGPAQKVKAVISLEAGKATFSVWQADKRERPWSQIPNAKATLSRASGNTHATLPPESFIANPPKYFLLKVDGERESVYTITGNWDIP